MQPRNEVFVRQSVLYVLMATVVACLCGCGGGSSSSTPPLPPPPTGTAMKVTFAGIAPLVVAEQIGTGAWAAATLQSGLLSFTLPQGTTTYAIAYVCPTVQGMGPLNYEYVIEATIQDGTTYAVSCRPVPTAGTVTGSVNASAIAGTANVQIYGQFGYGASVTGASGSFSAMIASGSNDIAVVAQDASSNVLGLKIVRSQTVPGAVNGGNAVTLASTDAVTTMQPISVTNVPAGFTATPSVGMYYDTSNQTDFRLLSSSSATQYPVVPASEAQSGDFYSFSAYTANASHQAVYIQQLLTTAAPIALQFPAPLTYTAPTPAAFPSFAFSYTGFSGLSAVADYAEMDWSTSATTQSILTVTATAGYQNGATNLVVPNLTSIPGFFPSASSGTTVNWQDTVYGGTYMPYTVLPATGTLYSALNSGTYTEP